MFRRESAHKTASVLRKNDYTRWGKKGITGKQLPFSRTRPTVAALPSTTYDSKRSFVIHHCGRPFPPLNGHRKDPLTASANLVTRARARRFLLAGRSYFRFVWNRSIVELRDCLIPFFREGQISACSDRCSHHCPGILSDDSTAEKLVDVVLHVQNVIFDHES